VPTHHRETLLAGLVTIIKNASTSCGNRVYRGRRIPIEDAELPVALVYQGDEESDLNDQNHLLRRVLEVFVELHQKNTPTTINDPGIDTALNELARQVEVAVQADATLGGLCLIALHVGTQTQSEDAEADRGRIRLQFSILYRTQRTDPSVQG
jgi:hypothetical protein